MLSTQWNNLKKQNSLKIMQQHHEENKLQKMFRVETGLGGDCRWTWQAWSRAEVEGSGAEGPGPPRCRCGRPSWPFPASCRSPAERGRRRSWMATVQSSPGSWRRWAFPGFPVTACPCLLPCVGTGGRAPCMQVLSSRPPHLAGGCGGGNRLSALRVSVIGQCASQAWPTPQTLQGWACRLGVSVTVPAPSRVVGVTSMDIELIPFSN